MSELILITGGARSGKSRWAAKLAEEGDGPVTFVATARAGDEEMVERIRRHRAARPPGWHTLEEGTDLVQIFSPEGPVGTVLVDCLTLYVSNLLLEGRPEEQILSHLRRVCEGIRRAPCRTIVVTNEVGWGVVPDHALGRTFRDVAGLANQIVAEYADEVYMVVSGLPIRIKPQISE